MREQDRRPDLVEQRDTRVAIELLDHVEILNVLDLRREELIERLIAGNAAARPLVVKLRLRIESALLGRGEAARHGTGVRPARRAVGVREETRTRAPRLID